MDLVNSVTQNSNNTNVTMENRSTNLDYSGGDDNDDKSGTSYTNPPTTVTEQLMNAATESIPEQSKQLQPNIATKQLQQSLPQGQTKAQVPDYLKAIGMDPRKFWPKKYRFTREKSPGQHNPLTISQRNFYESNGFIVIDDCVSQKLLNSIRAQYKESSLVSEFLVEKLVAKNGKFLQYVKCFCDENLMLMTNTMVEKFQSQESAKEVMDNKQVQRQQLFRDWIYLPFRPIDKVVCTITAIDPIEHVILVVPGTHKVGQCNISSTLENISAAYDTSQERSHQLMAREIFECAPENLSSLVEKSKKGFKYVNLKPGQTLFYHPGLVHGISNDLVNFNKSQLASIAYYAAADCEYIDLRKSSNLTAGTDLPISLSHFGDKNPSDYSSWLGRPRLIKENKANL